jgi:hypothetical protein
MKENLHLKQEDKPTLIDARYPLLLTRSMASSMSGFNGQYLDYLRKSGSVRVYMTKGGQFRFYRDDLINHIKNNLTNGQTFLQQQKG